MNETLCWYCKKAYGFCSWSDKSFTPVPGWEAEKTVIRCRYYVDDSYKVKSCPQFEQEDESFVSRMHSYKARTAPKHRIIMTTWRDKWEFDSLRKCAEFIVEHGMSISKKTESITRQLSKILNKTEDGKFVYLGIRFEVIGYEARKEGDAE